MSMEEFEAQVAWPRDQPSSSGRGGAFAAQRPVTEEPPAPALLATTTIKGEDELIPPEPFYFDANTHMPQEKGTPTDQIPEPSSAPAPEET